MEWEITICPLSHGIFSGFRNEDQDVVSLDAKRKTRQRLAAAGSGIARAGGWVIFRPVGFANDAIKGRVIKIAIPKIQGNGPMAAFVFIGMQRTAVADHEALQ